VEGVKKKERLQNKRKETKGRVRKESWVGLQFKADEKSILPE